MKKNILVLSAILISILSYSQTEIGISGKENWFEGWTNFNPKKETYRKTNKILSGTITENTILSNRYTYLLKGVVYITNNAILTIDPGTVIRGDYKSCGTLVVTKGAQLIANGTDIDPIVFTSNKDSYSRRAGDWGGIILIGDAPVNNFGGINILDFKLKPEFTNYGGDNPESSSGVLKYVRVEYSGRKLSSDKELNGISFAGVGNKTVIENIQISYSNDDSFEFYGGNVTVNNLISYRATDDDFDFTKGAQANINNSIAIRHPFSSDNQTSRAFEINTFDKVNNFRSSKNETNVIANNITLVNVEDNNQGLVKEAIYLDKNSHLTLKNSIVYGFRDFLVMTSQLYVKDFEKLVTLENLKISHCENDFSIKGNQKLQYVKESYNYLKHNIKISDDAIHHFFMNSDLNDNPDFRHNQNSNNFAKN